MQRLSRQPSRFRQTRGSLLTAPRLDVAVSARDGHDRVVTLSGELDASTAPALRESLTELIATASGAIVIDLHELEFIDSTGLGLLVGAKKQARDEGHDLVLGSPRRPVYRALEVAGLVDVFDIRPNRVKGSG